MAQTLPQGFQGKPVPTYCRRRSNRVQAEASISARRQPAGTARAAAQGAAMNTASSAESAGTAKGTSHQYRADSSRMASVIQYNPKTWWPKPKKKPRRAAVHAPRDPSSRHSRPGTVSSSTGMTCNGGRAAAESAPRPAARRSARQPAATRRRAHGPVAPTSITSVLTMSMPITPGPGAQAAPGRRAARPRCTRPPSYPWLPGCHRSRPRRAACRSRAGGGGASGPRAAARP